MASSRLASGINTLRRVLLPRERRLVRLRGGVSRGLVMSLDLGSQLQRLVGLDEREIMRDVMRLSRACSTLIDVGANDGYYTLAFLGSQAYKVVACEPGPSTSRLIANAAANHFIPGDRFRIERRMIGGMPDGLRAAELIEGLPGPILLKVDIDGGELELLESVAGSPRLGELNWVIETHSADLEDDCIGWLRSRDYTVRIVRNAWWRSVVPEQRPLDLNRWLVAEPRVR
jgi:hypothetical protein